MATYTREEILDAARKMKAEGIAMPQIQSFMERYGKELSEPQIPGMERLGALPAAGASPKMPDLPVSPTRLNPRTGNPIHDAPMGTVPLLDAPYTGGQRMIGGAKEMAKGNKARGASEMIRGGMEAASPAALPAAALTMGPLALAGRGLAGLMAQTGVEHGMNALGFDPGVSALSGDAAGFGMPGLDMALPALTRGAPAGALKGLASVELKDIIPNWLLSKLPVAPLAAKVGRGAVQGFKDYGIEPPSLTRSAGRSKVSVPVPPLSAFPDPPIRAPLKPPPLPSDVETSIPGIPFQGLSGGGPVRAPINVGPPPPLTPLEELTKPFADATGTNRLTSRPEPIPVPGTPLAIKYPASARGHSHSFDKDTNVASAAIKQGLTRDQFKALLTGNPNKARDFVQAAHPGSDTWYHVSSFRGRPAKGTTPAVVPSQVSAQRLQQVLEMYDDLLKGQQ
jgi:hypothetical protein